MARHSYRGAGASAGDAARRVYGFPDQNAQRAHLGRYLATYDSKNGTKFADALDVDHPEKAVQIDELVHQRNNHKRKVTPMQTLARLIKVFEKLPANNLATQGDMLEPQLIQVRDAAIRFLGMIHGSEAEADARR